MLVCSEATERTASTEGLRLKLPAACPCEATHQHIRQLLSKKDGRDCDYKVAENSILVLSLVMRGRDRWTSYCRQTLPILVGKGRRVADLSDVCKRSGCHIPKIPIADSQNQIF